MATPENVSTKHNELRQAVEHIRSEESESYTPVIKAFLAELEQQTGLPIRRLFNADHVTQEMWALAANLPLLAYTGDENHPGWKVEGCSTTERLNQGLVNHNVMVIEREEKDAYSQKPRTLFELTLHWKTDSKGEVIGGKIEFRSGTHPAGVGDHEFWQDQRKLVFANYHGNGIADSRVIEIDGQNGFGFPRQNGSEMESRIHNRVLDMVASKVRDWHGERRIDPALGLYNLVERNRMKNRTKEVGPILEGILSKIPGIGQFQLTHLGYKSE